MEKHGIREGGVEKRHLVRQTVLDAQRHLAGYELQVWEGRQGEAYTREPTPEGARLLISTIASPDLVRLVEERTVFLTFPGSFLFHDYEALLPEGRIVMVVPQPTQESGLLDAVRMRQAQGIRVGLEIDGSGPPPSPELAAQVDFLRFDLARWADPSELAAAVAPFRELGTPWVARGVHSQDAYQQCLSLGFGLFAGQFFTYPAVFSRDGLSSRQTALVEIFQKLTAGADFPDIEASFKAYPELTFQLLELLNSAAMRRKEPIYSIRQALVLLGQDNLRKWVALLLFTG
ncbi:MAG TPA: HDOD domain-containing protein, partial [Gammaproteobacteria bacterium]|nr:HDOD domain-containing protein [Gammaproteobacteria bacterium]